MLRRFRLYFLSGLLVVVPIGVTIWIVLGIFNFFDSWYRGFAIKYGIAFLSPNMQIHTGVGFFLTIFLISLIGFTTQLYFGKMIFGLIDRIFLQIPFISSIYNGLKQVGETLMGRQSRLFERVILIQYPRKGLYSLGFAVSRDKELISSVVGQNMVYVFIATTPNPTSGIFLIVPEDEIIELNVSVEDAMKMIISSGMVAPKVKGDVVVEGTIGSLPVAPPPQS
ncbi:MAG: DUF502 domain-containing protein [bacterium]|nr:DUF502 domain-containing protein [bacterium]